MPVAVVALDFDPVLRLGDLAVRLDTLVAAAGILVAILVAGWFAIQTPAPERDEEGHFIGRRPLRLDDLLFIVLAAIPGAVVGGRLGYVLLHLDYYGANPGAIVDPGQGSLELSLAVAGAAATGGYGAKILAEAAGRWFHVAALPTLLALGIGKLAMAVGGSGQGLPSAAAWATSYVGPGPWGSLAPAIPAHPAQLYEAAAIAVVAAIVVILAAGGLFDRRDGLAWLVAIALWAAARTVIASTWRDAPVLGPLRADQLLSIGLAVACVAIGVAVSVRPVAGTVFRRNEPSWPDPESRPRF